MCGRRFLSILALVLLVLPAAPASAATTRAEQDRDYPDIIARAGTYAYDGATGEASGLVASRRYPGYYWMIQDPAAGVDRSALFALRFDHRSNVSTAGTLLDFPDGSNTNRIEVDNATNLDWEAITLDTADRLWVADSGATPGNRTTGRFYVFSEPAPWSTAAVAPVAVYDYRFPDRPALADVEAVFSVGDVVYLITKTLDNAVVYRLNPIAGRVTDLVRIGSLATGDIERITGAELSPDGRRFVVISQRGKRSFVWSDNRASIPTTISGADALVRSYIGSSPTWAQYFTRGGPGGPSLQVEGVAFPPPGLGQALVLVSEGSRHAMYVRTGTYEASPWGGPPPASFTCASVRQADGQFVVSWTSVAAVDNYVVARTVNGNGPYWRGARTPPATSWRDTGNLAPGDATVAYQVQTKVGPNVAATANCR